MQALPGAKEGLFCVCRGGARGDLAPRFLASHQPCPPWLSGYTQEVTVAQNRLATAQAELQVVQDKLTDAQVSGMARGWG